MRGTVAVIPVLAALTLAVGVATANAEDGDCKAICTKTRDSCLQQCPGSPDPAQCKGNCEAVYQGCLTNCAES